MSEDFFAPSSDLQAEIDAARQAQLDARRNKRWTSGRGVLLPRHVDVRPIESGAVSASACSYAPGSVWPVASHNHVTIIPGRYGLG